MNDDEYLDEFGFNTETTERTSPKIGKHRPAMINQWFWTPQYVKDIREVCKDVHRPKNITGLRPVSLNEEIWLS